MGCRQRWWLPPAAPTRKNLQRRLSSRSHMACWLGQRPGLAGRPPAESGGTRPSGSERPREAVQPSGRPPAEAEPEPYLGEKELGRCAAPGAPAPRTRGPGARGGGARDRAHPARLAGRGAHGGRCVAVRKAEVARPATAAPRSGATRGSPSAPGAPPAPRTPHPPPRRSPLSQQRLPRSPLSPGSSGLGLF